MKREAFYTWKDESGKVRLVRSVRGTGTFQRMDGVGVVASDVEDVLTGELFKAVPVVELKLFSPPPK